MSSSKTGNEILRHQETPVTVTEREFEENPAGNASHFVYNPEMGSTLVETILKATARKKLSSSNSSSSQCTCKCCAENNELLKINNQLLKSLLENFDENSKRQNQILNQLRNKVDQLEKSISRDDDTINNANNSQSIVTHVTESESATENGSNYNIGETLAEAKIKQEEEEMHVEEEEQEEIRSNFSPTFADNSSAAVKSGTIPKLGSKNNRMSVVMKKKGRKYKAVFRINRKSSEIGNSNNTLLGKQDTIVGATTTSNEQQKEFVLLPDEHEIARIRFESVSRANFATKLVRRIFSNVEVANKNVNGRKGKDPLDPFRMAWVKHQVFFHFPPTESGGNNNNQDQNQNQAWNKCVKIIDSTLRRGRRSIEAKKGGGHFKQKTT